MKTDSPPNDPALYARQSIGLGLWIERLGAGILVDLIQA